jgi:uncharacterized phage protein (TIGR02220 family)
MASAETVDRLRARLLFFYCKSLDRKTVTLDPAFLSALLCVKTDATRQAVSAILRVWDQKQARLKWTAGKAVVVFPAGTTEVERGATRKVFDYWIKRLGKTDQTRFSEKRRKKIHTRLKEGFTVEQLCRAIDAMASDEFYNPRSGKKYNDIELVCRSSDKVEKFLEQYSERESRGTGSSLRDRVRKG